ncbi:MAG TPA: F0F1 ATP synthase subunit A [Cytophagaceae bacterium]|jgi:F-type H+-transporting ATPase subunit a|nr:F0F1 ATP synthase subunit A [Cytophagaceae bacterium]
MQSIKKYTLTILVLLLVVPFSYGSEETVEIEKKAFNAGEMIMHHIGDSHEWHFVTIGHSHITLYLPVIIYNPEKGIDFFSSANFVDEHGHPNMHHGSYGDYIIHNDKIHSTKEHATIYDISITKNVASLLLSFSLLTVIFISIALRYKKHPLSAPKGIQSFFEPIIAYIIDEVAKPILGEKKYKKYLPYLLTVFFFIWFNNLLGLIPGGANLTGNIAVTMVLAVITFLLTNLSANKNYWKHIFWTPGVPLPLRVILLPIEVVGIFTKPFSLMIRLFANITAGHIIILSFIGLIFIFNSLSMAPVTIIFGLFMSFMELFVAILQAYIFTLLSAMYIGSAIEEHHAHDHDHGH